MSIISFGRTLSRLGRLTSKVGVEALRHPGKAAIEGFGIYSGWNYLTKGKTVAETGKEVIEKGKDVVYGKGSSDKGMARADGALGNAPGLRSDIQHTKEGIANSLRGLFSGNGSNMLGDFAKNLFSGNVKGLDLTLLVAGAWLLLSRHSHMLGKLTGAMLTLSAIGLNAGLSHENTYQQSRTPANDISQLKGSTDNEGYNDDIHSGLHR